MNTTGQSLEPVQRLLTDLSSKDEQTRHYARIAIERVGSPATPGLVALLSSGAWRARLEAASALDAIRDPAAAPALVAALEDENPGVRWMAAQALKSLGRHGLVAVLEQLINPSCSVWQREGAHHVLSSYRRVQVMARVLAALDGIEPRYDAAIAAEAALEELDREARQHPKSTTPQLRTH